MYFKNRQDKRVERSTGETKKRAAQDEGERIIADAYGQRAERTKGIEWQSAKEKLEKALKADQKRPKTINGYLETLNKLIAIFPDSTGPCRH